MSSPLPAHSQASYRVRFDWGPDGARALVADAGPGDVAVVVDVLSFTTTLSMAVDRGITTYPYPWRDDGAPSYAAERDAVLATGRREGLATGAVSLSPASLTDVGPERGVERLVLPSPNGSTIAFALGEAGATVVGASLRNAELVGRWLAERPVGRVVAVAAGERWPDGSLRPAIEDLWGAGAVLSALFDRVGRQDASPEAVMAATSYDAVRDLLPAALLDCASGRELVGAGFEPDVRLSAEVNAGHVVPVLRGDGFAAG